MSVLLLALELVTATGDDEMLVVNVGGVAVTVVVYGVDSLALLEAGRFR